MATQLPLSKIKKIIRYDDLVKLISSDGIVATTIAVEQFIQALANASYGHAQSGKRQTVQGKDVHDAIRTNEWCVS